jgi:N-acyl-phosphatidylethanolamine-hydrolysing phospholipase D
VIAVALLGAIAGLLGCGVFARTAEPTGVVRPAMPVADGAGTRSLQVFWIGHATVLVRMDDRWILTDPHFGARLAGVQKRRVAPAMQPDELPPIDCVVVSHAHFDHLDPASLAALDPTATLAVPTGILTFLDERTPFGTIASLDDWRGTDCHGVRITAVPARHGQGRYLVDALWHHETAAGFVFEYHGMTVYFAGDTGYDERLFASIGRRFRIDLALLPFGPAGRPRWIERLRRSVHMTPDDSLRAFAVLGAQWLVPMHWGTFFKDPAVERRAITAAIARDPRRDRVRLLEVGQATEMLW